MEKVNCPYCHKENLNGNFCTECGRKIVDVCDCWVMHCYYNCGQETCPGLKLLSIKKRDDGS